MEQKKKIYYARTYRKIRTNFNHALLYLFLLVLPVLILLILNIKNITWHISNLTVHVLSQAIPGKEFTVIESSFVPFGLTYSITASSSYPLPGELLINILVVMGIICILTMSSIRGRPFAIYMLFSCLVHIITCVYCIFEKENFVYTATEFADLYMKQQISIWILFVVMMGIVTAFIGASAIRFKVTAFFALLAYSAVFGVVRYIVFMFILARGSVLYMADMFFTVGPLFDFLYLVFVYSFYSDRMEKYLDSPEGEDEWQWL